MASTIAWLARKLSNSQLPKFSSVDEAILQHDVNKLKHRAKFGRHKKYLSNFIDDISEDVQQHVLSFLDNQDLQHLSLTSYHFHILICGMKKHLELSHDKILACVNEYELEEILQLHEWSSMKMSIIPQTLSDEYVQVIRNMLICHSARLEKLDLNYYSSLLFQFVRFSRLSQLTLRNYGEFDLREVFNQSAQTLKQMTLNVQKGDQYLLLFSGQSWTSLKRLSLTFISSSVAHQHISDILNAVPVLTSLTLKFKSLRGELYLFDILNSVAQHANCAQLSDLVLKLSGELLLKEDTKVDRSLTSLRKLRICLPESRKVDCLLPFLVANSQSLRDLSLENVLFDSTEPLCFPVLERLRLKCSANTVRSILNASSNLSHLDLSLTDEEVEPIFSHSVSSSKLVSNLTIPADLTLQDVEYIARNMTHVTHLSVRNSCRSEPAKLAPLSSLASKLSHLSLCADVALEDMYSLVASAQTISNLSVMSSEFILNKPISATEVMLKIENRLHKHMHKTFTDYMPFVTKLDLSCYAVSIKRLAGILSKMNALTSIRVDTVWNSNVWGADGENKSQCMTFPYKPNVTSCEISMEEGYFSSHHLILLAAAFFNATHFKLINEYSDIDSIERRDVSYSIVRSVVRSICKNIVEDCLSDASKCSKEFIVNTVERQLSCSDCQPTHYVLRKLLLDSMNFHYIFQSFE